MTTDKVSEPRPVRTCHIQLPATRFIIGECCYSVFSHGFYFPRTLFRAECFFWKCQVQSYYLQAYYMTIDCKLSLQLVLFRLFHSMRVFFEHSVKKLLRTKKYRTKAWQKIKVISVLTEQFFDFNVTTHTLPHTQPNFSTNIRIHHVFVVYVSCSL